MFDTLVTFVKNILKTRTVPLILIYLCFSVILVYKVFTIQVVRQEELTKDTVTQEVVTRETKATRGNIYDCNGVLLAYNIGLLRLLKLMVEHCIRISTLRKMRMDG